MTQPRNTYGAICLVLTLWFFIGQPITQAASRAPYSLIDNNISDLGSTTCGPISVFTYTAYTCSPLHVIMNLTFVGVGLLTILGILGTRRIWPSRPMTRFGVGLLLVSGADEILAGLAPEDVQPGLHVFASVLGIGGANLGILLLGLTVWRAQPWVGVMSVLLSGIGLFGLLIAPSLGIGTGAAERVAGYPVVMWTILIGGFLLRRTEKCPLAVQGKSMTLRR